MIKASTFEQKRWVYLIIGIFILFSIGGVVWQQNQIPAELDLTSLDNAALSSVLNEPIEPIPSQLDVELDEKKVELGNKLFHDPRLSADNTIACATCHSLQTGGVDGQPRSIGINGALGEINTPTVFNSGFNFRQFWDGRAKDLEEQIDGPTHDPLEMGSNWRQIIDKLNKSPDDVAAFNDSYPDGITNNNIKDAIATFERSLYTPNSRFDQFLRGDSNAISEEEKEGYALFKRNGCISCHQGMNAGGNIYQKFGILGDYFADRGNITEADYGRFNITAEEADRHVFKVPSLRNVALTGPYFHDASAQTLEEAVDTMAKYQLGRTLSGEEINLIVKFLKTLTGEYKGISLE
ncbi:MAG: cytochrome-c peroxidase [Ardenticatenaceae bacterium]